MGEFAPKHHYICRDAEGNLFMTTEKCASMEEAQQFVGENEVLYPFLEVFYEEAVKEQFEGYKAVIDAPMPDISKEDAVLADTGENEPDFYSCSSCGYEITEEDVKVFHWYSRTTASGDHYFCPKCNEEGFTIPSETPDR